VKILVIGGTQFIGRHLSLELINSGHEVVLFHKNKTHEFGDLRVEHIIGDRRLPANQRLNGNFDLVIDTCAFKPSDLDFLTSVKFQRYLFVSTVAVFSPDIPEGGDENAQKIDDHQLGIGSKEYGVLKRYTEDFVSQKIPNAAVVRPAVVLGPGDNSRRLDRIYEDYVREQTLHAPLSDDNSLITQFIDVRDLVKLVVEIVSKDLSGSFNLVGKTVHWNDFVSTIASVVGTGLISEDSASFPLWDTTKSRGLRTLQSSHDFIRNFNFTTLEDSLKDWFCEYQKTV